MYIKNNGKANKFRVAFEFILKMVFGRNSPTTITISVDINVSSSTNTNSLDINPAGIRLSITVAIIVLYITSAILFPTNIVEI
jgi:hypothetical protein